MSILDITVVSVALQTFQKEFDATSAQVAWTMTGYTLALATVIPLTGWAADRFGTKRLYLLAIVLFTAGSVLCAAATPRDAGRLPGPPGPRRRDAHAARHDDPDPRRRPRAGRPGDGRARHPDAARPDLRPDPRRLADRHRVAGTGSSSSTCRSASPRSCTPPSSSPRTTSSRRRPSTGSACCCSRPASRRSCTASPRSRSGHPLGRRGAGARDHRPGAHRRVRPLGAPQATSTRWSSCGCSRTAHDRRGDRDGAVRDRVLRRQPAVPAVLPAGPRRGRPAAPACCWPRKASARCSRCRSPASSPTGSARARSC